jgi:hypothetical protein
VQWGLRKQATPLSYLSCSLMLHQLFLKGYLDDDLGIVLACQVPHVRVLSKPVHISHEEWGGIEQ